MPTHDIIIDNREKVLLEHVKGLLRDSVSAKFAVGYPLHQRIGRLDRIGALADTVYVHNFLPEKKLEKHLHLKERIQSRINPLRK